MTDLRNFINEETLKNLANNDDAIFKQAQFLHMTESYGVRISEKILEPHFPEEEMRKDLIWHHDQERVHARGFKQFLEKHNQPTELPDIYKGVFNTNGKFYEQFVDLKTLLPGQKYFSNPNLYAYYIFLEYEENFGGSSYLVLAELLEESGKYPDFQSLLRKFSKDEFDHAKYARKWVDILDSRMTSMSDIKARGQIHKLLSQIKRQAMPKFYDEYFKTQFRN